GLLPNVGYGTKPSSRFSTALSMKSKTLTGQIIGRRLWMYTWSSRLILTEGSTIADTTTPALQNVACFGLINTIFHHLFPRLGASYPQRTL
ncbi:hypothetical protein C0991_004646, partial [Blastosporella zonata]